MDKCGVTCMLRWEFRLSSDQGHGEQFTCSARKSVELQCCIFSPSTRMELVPCPSIILLQFICCKNWWIMEVTHWMDNSDIAELACCTLWRLMFIVIFLTTMIWSVAQLLSYHGEGVHVD
jgi:hypothetical protein